MPLPLAALLISALIAAPADAARASTSAAATQGANEILDHALQAWRNRTYPPYMRYLIDVRANVKGRLYAEGFQAWVRTGDDFVITTQAPLYSTNQQANPYGTRFSILGWNFEAGSGVNTPFGVPRISPFYSFGFVPQSAVDFHPHPPTTNPSDANVLGTVTVTARFYNATLVGEEQCDTGMCWHLALAPVVDPGEYRVRAMWVDEDTFQPTRLTVAGIFNGCSATTVRWDVRYMNFHGQWLLREESTNQDVRDGGSLFGWGAATFHGLTYTLGHYHFFDNFNDYEFFDRGSTLATQV
jgi:hypothetical protein